jgi:endonuclease YncB( thermonuclease family)
MLCLRGELVVVGKQPDGDSIRFVPRSPDLLGELRRAFRIRPSKVDGSVQLRLEGIDAPETHYGRLAQPLGDLARDRALELCGFERVARDDDEQDETVTGATPERVAAAALSQLADANGRPVSLLLVGDELPRDGERVPVDGAVLERTVNRALIADGTAYLMLYESLAPSLRAALRETATAAAGERLGVWGRDTTDEFLLADQDSIGPGGQLILPKLFRRCSDYLATRSPHETLPHWLRTHGDPGRPEDDEVLVGGRTPVHLSELVEQRNRQIAFNADLLDVVFIEK